MVHGLPRGGLENGVINIANGLPRPEFEQTICCLDSRGEMAERLPPAVPVHVLNRRRYDLKAPYRLAQLIRTVEPDIVHCRNWNTWLDCVAARLLALRPVRLVWSFHGFADGHHFPRRRRYVSHLLARLTPYLMAVCQDSAARYARLAGIAEERFAVLYNGVDTTRFRPAADRQRLRAELGLPTDRVLVTTVGSLTPVKNHLGLLEAAASYARTRIVDTTFLLVGEGALRRAIEARIAALGIADEVVLYGASDRVPDLLAASDVFVLPSHLEGMSNAILEAMASGLPVVALRVGGNPELVRDGHTGLLCPPGDAEALAGAIGRLAQNPDLRAQLGQNARRVAEETFSIAAMIRSYAAFYRSVMGPARVEGRLV